MSTHPALAPKALSSFTHSPVSINEIVKLVHASPNKMCDLDPIPIFFLKQVSATALDIIETIVKRSISISIFPIHL